MMTRTTTKGRQRANRGGYAPRSQRRQLKESMGVSALVAFASLVGGSLLVATGAGENAMVNFVPAMWVGWLGLAIGTGAALFTIALAVAWLWTWR